MNTTAIRLTASRGLLLGKKYLPEILLGVGLVAGVVTTVMACKATLKAQYIIADAKTGINQVKEATANFPEKYSAEDRKQDLIMVYSRAGIELVKTYGPALTLGVASLACILASRNITSKRLAGMAAAYKIVEKSFSDYRERVVGEFGNDVDRQMKYGVETVKVEEQVKNEATGKTKTVKKDLEIVDPNNISRYSRFFDDLNPMWQGNPEYNKMFLLAQQNFANQKLHAYGHLFLNDVYKALGYEDTQEGAVVGWILSKDSNSDNFVDFGVFDTNRKMNRDFVNGYESAILLDFNVDGLIFDKI